MNKKLLLVTTVFSILLLAGCGTSTQDLISEAQLTDDWTQVNSRFSALDRRDAQSLASCPSGRKSWCVKRLSQMKCSCVNDSDGRDILRDMFEQ